MKQCLKFSHLIILLSLTAGGNSLANFNVNEVSELIDNKNGAIEDNVEVVSSVFLGRKYNTLGPLGEGYSAKYDQDPLWRTDEFDCTTYVETVMAILLSDSIDEFKQRMNMIRYLNGEISFVNRNHFTSLDWIPRNIDQGYIEDITNEVFEYDEVLEAETIINKKNWYKKMGEARVSLSSKSNRSKSVALKELREEGVDFEPEIATINYMPINKIFNANKSVKKSVFSKIKSGHIINIVRPNWNLEKYIGTNLNVSHQGFAIRHNNKLFFRHASPSGEGVVTQQVLSDYLRNYIGHKTIKGINIIEIKE